MLAISLVMDGGLWRDHAQEALFDETSALPNHVSDILLVLPILNKVVKNTQFLPLADASDRMNKESKSITLLTKIWITYQRKFHSYNFLEDYLYNTFIHESFCLLVKIETKY